MKFTDINPGDEATAATLTLFEAGAMTDRGRRNIAEWLHEQADKLLAGGDQYSEKYEAEYRFIRQTKE